MNQAQANQIKTYAQQIEDFDFNELIKQIFPDRTDLENMSIDQYSASEFIELSKKVMYNFITEMSLREYYILLPFTYINAQLGQANLDNQLQNFFGYLNPVNINNAAHILQWLINYQIENSIFKSKNELRDKNVSKSATKLVEELNLLEINIENKIKEISKIQVDLDINKNNLQALIDQKTVELTTITNNLITSNTQTAQIGELLSRAIEQGTRISSIQESQDSNKLQYDKKLSDLEFIYSSANIELNNNSKIIKEQLDQFKEQVVQNDKHLKFVEGKREFFEERINTYMN